LRYDEHEVDTTLRLVLGFESSLVFLDGEVAVADPIAGKVAVVTGGATGIGKAVATRLAAAGASVVIAGRDLMRGKTSATDLARHGYQVRFFRTDVRIENAVTTLYDYAVDTFGGLDFLFNNAGIEGVLGPIEASSEEIIDDVLAINVKGMFLCMKQVLPLFVRQGGGTIVNTSSFVGTVLPFPEAVLLGATQAGVISMTQSVAKGFAGENINVFAVCPWLTDTPMVDRLTQHQVGEKSRLAGMNPSGRAATPEDVANVVLALFAGDTSFQSGDAVLVDHGGATQKIRPMSA
jgi:NAD(P)-dependent dehydrogenase (short-subunit alcohol dehydrogenase family)